MEIIGIMLWSKQFLDTISDNDKKLLRYILHNKNDSILINNNLYKQIIHKKYKYRKTNRTYSITAYSITAYNIIDICFSKVLNMI